MPNILFDGNGNAAFKLNGMKIAQEWTLALTNISNYENVFPTTYNNNSRKMIKYFS